MRTVPIFSKDEDPQIFLPFRPAQRNNDTSSLGDWDVINTPKLPYGLDGLALAMPRLAKSPPNPALPPTAIQPPPTFFLLLLFLTSLRTGAATYAIRLWGSHIGDFEFQVVFLCGGIVPGQPGWPGAFEVESPKQKKKTKHGLPGSPGYPGSLRGEGLFEGPQAAHRLSVYSSAVLAKTEGLSTQPTKAPSSRGLWLQHVLCQTGQVSGRAGACGNRHEPQRHDHAHHAHLILLFCDAVSSLSGGPAMRLARGRAPPGLLPSGGSDEVRAHP